MATTAEDEQRLRTAREVSCEYGLTPWHRLDEMRRYLLDSAPEPPREDGPRRRAATPSARTTTRAGSGGGPLSNP